MFGDRGGDLRPLTASCCIITAHNALKFRKFTDHAGDQISLSETGRAAGRSASALPVWRATAPARAAIGRFLCDCAQPFIKGDRAQPVLIIGKRGLAIHIIKEFRIRQAGPQHPLIPGRDQFIMGRIRHTVGHSHKIRGQLIRLSGCRKRKKFLMYPHRGHQHLRRQGHKVRFNLADNRGRPFHKTGNFIQQPVISHRLQAVAPGYSHPAGRRSSRGGLYDQPEHALPSYPADSCQNQTRSPGLTGKTDGRLFL